MCVHACVTVSKTCTVYQSVYISDNIIIERRLMLTNSCLIMSQFAMYIDVLRLGEPTVAIQTMDEQIY